MFKRKNVAQQQPVQLSFTADERRIASEILRALRQQTLELAALRKEIGGYRSDSQGLAAATKTADAVKEAYDLAVMRAKKADDRYERIEQKMADINACVAKLGAASSKGK